MKFKGNKKPNTKLLWYLVHPLHTYGSPDLNRSLVQFVKREFNNMNVYYISPISIIPPNTPESIAMEKCDCLLMACDGVVLCQNWEKSKGCRHERMFAEKLGLEIIEIEED